ncbi:HECT-domain-containing protein [Marasmius fiardii PR-910]|nr:HECT-domain-containing protein [Marasmius fiardii PR-910]
MLPLFNGPEDTRRRQINLGGKSTTNTAQSTLESAKARRNERIEHRRRVDAAIRLQAWWRGEVERRRIRRRFSREIEEGLAGDLLEIEIVRRVCFVGKRNLDENGRLVLGKWSQGVVERDFDRVSTLSPTNLSVLTTILLSLVSKDVNSPLSTFHITLLTKLTSLSTMPPNSDFYCLLSISIREVSKSSPILPNLITLLFSPRTSDQTISYLLTLVLTIPLLPNRLPLQTLTAFSASLPLAQLTPRNVQDIASTLLTTEDRIHLLSNLLAFTSPRYTKLPKSALAAYLKLVADILYLLPVNIFDPEAQKRSRDEPEDDDMNEIRVTVVDSFDVPLHAPLPTVDAKTLKRIQTLVSPTHIASLLSTTASTSSERYQLFRVLGGIFHVWPGKKDSVGSLIWNTSSGQVGGIVKELWRGYVRSSGLGRETASTSAFPISSGGESGGGGGGVYETLIPVVGQQQPRLLGPREPSEVEDLDPWPVLLLLAEIYTQALGTMGDDEFFGTSGGDVTAKGGLRTGVTKTSNPLSIDDLTLLSRNVLNIVWVLYVYPPPTLRFSSTPTLSWTSIRTTLVRLLRAVHARDARRSFVPSTHWIKLRGGEEGWNAFVEAALVEEERLRILDSSDVYNAGNSAMDVDLEYEGDEDDSYFFRPLRAQPPPPPPAQTTMGRMREQRKYERLAKHQRILEDIPFAVPFELRVRVFRSYVLLDQVMRRERVGGGGGGSVVGRIQALANNNNFIRYPGQRRNRVEIRRNHLAEDGFDKLGNSQVIDLKDPVEVVFRDQWGEEEAGIDGGGLFKEFFTSLSKEAFDLGRGLWNVNKEGELYPRAGGWSEESHSLAWYRFIGKILGKALYDGILVDVVFASFFLAKWLRTQSPTFFDDLRSLDEELWNGLVFLKRLETEGEVESLGLRFCVDVEEFGVSRTVDLVPDGSGVAVTKENRLQYIYLLAHFKLSKQIRKQSLAFFEGVGEVIEERWIRMFTPKELSHLLGGSSQPVDIEDLRKHTVYGGLYDDKSPIINAFWDVVNGFTEDQRRSLLRFVTSCSRPPLLGFKELFPQFAIRDAGEDQNRLPTASTCVNLLKLPRYGSSTVLRQKLLQAINSGAGFDLS